ncbi:metallopeptidase M20 [Aspergillus niger]|nr:metallopeptidase M20 [Aspergillus niger]
MEESGSVRVSEFAQEHKDIFTKVDAACISDNHWLTTRKPCLTYGLRDISYFTITIAQKPMPGHEPVPLHSGIYRGTVNEPMTELVIMLSKLAGSNGNILIPSINGLVDDVTPDEIAQYEGIDFDMDEFRNTIVSEAAIYATAKDTLMHRWRYPSITIHGINGADPSPNQTTAICPKVTGKFSIRTVPTMEGKVATALVVHYLEQKFKKLGSKNTCELKQFGDSAPYWVGNTEDSNFAAGRAATDIGATLDIQNALGHDKSIMLLPVGRSDDGAHGPDEKLDRDNYIKGKKLLVAYWWYFANA